MAPVKKEANGTYGNTYSDLDGDLEYYGIKDTYTGQYIRDMLKATSIIIKTSKDGYDLKTKTLSNQLTYDGWFNESGPLYKSEKDDYSTFELVFNIRKILEAENADTATKLVSSVEYTKDGSGKEQTNYTYLEKGSKNKAIYFKDGVPVECDDLLDHTASKVKNKLCIVYGDAGDSMTAEEQEDTTNGRSFDGSKLVRLGCRTIGAMVAGTKADQLYCKIDLTKNEN